MNSTTTIDTTNLLILVLVMAALVVMLMVFLIALAKRRTVAVLQETEAELMDTTETVDSLRIRITRATQNKNDAFRERNYLVCLLIRTLIDNKIEGWSYWKGYTEEYQGWEGVAYLSHPKVGQISWHFAREDQWLLDSLKLESGPLWDGRTSTEKYDSLRQYLLQQ